ncbi:hypothetical protein SAMN02745150_00728 [Brevinema andersonii]|uniref:Uncharacterized protein n=1 Tax=Brevinema andersonii TaxID=34097 RepID=A0A1I1DRT6_BREAD|nr:hypothetical protein SAMN02745150_00728 [Brevinema andersonii]
MVIGGLNEKLFICLFIVYGCSQIDNRSGISAVTNVTGTYNYLVQLTSSGITSEFQILVPIITVSWYSEGNCYLIHFIKLFSIQII